VVSLHRNQPGKPLSVQLPHGDVDVSFTSGGRSPLVESALTRIMLQLLPPLIRSAVARRKLAITAQCSLIMHLLESASVPFIQRVTESHV